MEQFDLPDNFKTSIGDFHYRVYLNYNKCKNDINKAMNNFKTINSFEFNLLDKLLSNFEFPNKSRLYNY